MDLKLRVKVALVTCSSRGIGLAIGKAFARRHRPRPGGFDHPGSVIRIGGVSRNFGAGRVQGRFSIP